MKQRIGIVVVTLMALLGAAFLYGNYSAGVAEQKRQVEEAERVAAQRLAAFKRNPKENISLRDMVQKRGFGGAYLAETNFTIVNNNPAAIKSFTLKCNSQDGAASGGQTRSWTQELDSTQINVFKASISVPAKSSKEFFDIRLKNPSPFPMSASCEVNTVTMEPMK